MNPALRTAAVSGVSRQFDVDTVRADFPILTQRVNGTSLVYLDNAATTQKPKVVIDAMDRYYTEENSNIHRGVHFLSEKATESYEASRVAVQQWINAASPKEIIFTSGTTDSINLVASSFGRMSIGAGSEVLISVMEHHSNIVPWQMVCEERGARLVVLPMTDAGELMMESLPKLLTSKVKLVAIGHVSNALGTINPVREIIRLAHERGIPVLVDGAQAVAHLRVDVRELDADFYAFSGHKMYGPTGIGILYGKEALLNAMPPYRGGGDMIKSVRIEKTIYNDLPQKFEAGTPNIAGGIGLGAAVKYLSSFDQADIARHEDGLLAYATASLERFPGIRLVGTARKKAGVVSFMMDGIHPHDIGTILDDDGIAIRTGHHCAQPVMERLAIPATARASFGVYNTKEEIDLLVRGLGKVREVLG